MTRLNVTISRVLVIGLLAAVTLLLVGVVRTIARPGLAPVHETSVQDIPRAVAALEPAGFFDLGLLLLLATPIARVVALLLGFVRRKMWLFSGFSVIVLAALAVSAFFGLRG
jgi:uncharacterized membrane protein